MRLSVPFVNVTGGGKPHVIMADNMGECGREMLHAKRLADDKGVQGYREYPRNASTLVVKNVELIAELLTEFFRRRPKRKQRREIVAFDRIRHRQKGALLYLHFKGQVVA